MGSQEIVSTSHKLDNLRNMLRYLLVGLVFGCQVFGLPTTDSSSTSSTSPSISDTTKVTCDPHAECRECVAVTGCVFVKYKETSQECQLPSEVSADPVQPEIFNDTKSCTGSGEDTTLPPTTTPTPTPSDPSTTTSETTTTTDVTTTTATETTTTITTTTTTPETTTSTKPTTTTTTTTPASTASTTSTSTEVPGPEPDTGKGHFDGWSFFGGILLTLGLAAIGLVGYKYYRLRSGTGGNYNRF